MILREYPDKTAIIDADSLIYAVGFASEDAEEKIALARMAERLEDMLFLELGVEKYEGYLTGQGNFRKHIAVTAPYKGQRTGAKPKHYNLLREYLVEAWGFVVVDGSEADDKVVQRHFELGSGSILAGIDKDGLQSPGLHYNWQKQNVFEVSVAEGLKNFYRQVLTGDRIDNIIGIRGIGPAKADKLLEGCVTAVQMYDACAAAYTKDIEKTGLVGDNANNAAHIRVHENAQLLWMCRVESEIWHYGIEEKYYG